MPSAQYRKRRLSNHSVDMEAMSTVKSKRMAWSSRAEEPHHHLSSTQTIKRACPLAHHADTIAADWPVRRLDTHLWSLDETMCEPVPLRQQVPCIYRQLTVQLPGPNDVYYCDYRSPCIESPPFYLGTTRLPVHGWFQSCRGCGGWTVHSYTVTQQHVPLCRKCKHKFNGLTNNQTKANTCVASTAARRWESALLAVHKSWSDAIQAQVQRELCSRAVCMSHLDATPPPRSVVSRAELRMLI